MVLIRLHGALLDAQLELVAVPRIGDEIRYPHARYEVRKVLYDTETPNCVHLFVESVINKEVR